MKMPDFQRMYYIMFYAVNKAEELLEWDTKAAVILREALYRCESYEEHWYGSPVPNLALVMEDLQRIAAGDMRPVTWRPRSDTEDEDEDPRDD